MFHTSYTTLYVEPDGKVNVRSVPPINGRDIRVSLQHTDDSGSTAGVAFYGEPFAVAAVIDLLAAAAQQQVPGYGDACRQLGYDPTTDLGRWERVRVWDEVERLRTVMAAAAVTDEAVAGTVDNMLALSGIEMVREDGVDVDDRDAAYDARAQAGADAAERHADAVSAGARFMESSPQKAVR